MDDNVKAVGDSVYVGVNTSKTFHIAEVYAVLSEDAKGNEGICGYMGGEYSDGPLPFVFHDKAKLDAWMPLIRQMAADTKTFGNKLRLVKFTQRTEIEEL